jgi:flavin-dependent dehydrogenase
MTNRLGRIEFLIVGGGPAGSAAAITLAAAGRKVVVLERTDYSKPRIGETLPPAVNPMLRQLGFTDCEARDLHVVCPGTACCWGCEKPSYNDFLFDPDGDGWHLDRPIFDLALSRKAEAAGAEIWTNSAILRCQRLDDGYHIDIRRGDQLEHCHVSTLLDAAGRHRWPGRRSRRRILDRQVAVWGVFRLDKAASACDRRTWIESTFSGWWYSDLLPGDRLVAAYFTDADLLAPHARWNRGLWDELAAQAPHLMARLHSTSAGLLDVRVVPASSTISTPIAEDRYAAIGDAASTIDPLSSHGILYALQSGCEAAEALIAQRPARALRRYALGIEARFREDLATRRQFCRLERRWPDSPFWQRRAEFATAHGT